MPLPQLTVNSFTHTHQITAIFLIRASKLPFLSRDVQDIPGLPPSLHWQVIFQETSNIIERGIPLAVLLLASRSRPWFPPVEFIRGSSWQRLDSFWVSLDFTLATYRRPPRRSVDSSLALFRTSLRALECHVYRMTFCLFFRTLPCSGSLANLNLKATQLVSVRTNVWKLCVGLIRPSHNSLASVRFFLVKRLCPTRSRL